MNQLKRMIPIVVLAWSGAIMLGCGGCQTFDMSEKEHQSWQEQMSDMNRRRDRWIWREGFGHTF